MLGYELQDLNEMTYGIDSALLMINQDENPAIARYLTNASDFLNGLWAEGYFD
jgi:hypothetical protein